MGARYKGMIIYDPKLKYFIKIFTLKNPCKKCLVNMMCSEINDDICESKENWYQTWGYIEHYKLKVINLKYIPRTIWLFIKDKIEPTIIYTLMVAFCVAYVYIMWFIIELNWRMWNS